VSTKKRPPTHHAAWDAGDMGCGELVIHLKLRMQRMEPGQVMFLTAEDPGAVEDIPAWCGLTRNTLAHMEHPHYWITKKET
jgi:tRNA 2-thiouridine synthesizing protein A